MFFCDFGSVAVEVAMKMAVQFWLNRGAARAAQSFLSFRGGYHGDTFAAMSVCDPEEGMHALFAGVLAKQIIVDLPTDRAARGGVRGRARRPCADARRHYRRAVGAGRGRHDLSCAGNLAQLRRAADRHGLLLIFDEVFTGFGRTGTLFACEAAGVCPTSWRSPRR